MEPQPPLATDENLNLETSSIKEGDSDVISSSQCDILPQEPVLTTERKPTRQWAAWTRQEEESFFTALRQVGKNFEKITSRVQSKNKDQVRHYYYRLVRRMNKLLGQGLSIDAKNSKDTIAAMLRWWSLLEKYSCKASKLHLKPRRFKIFVETLEHQLLKDRKKNLKKRLSHVDNCSPTAASTVSNQSGASAQDTHTVKPDLVGGQNIEKLPGRGSLLKRCSNLNANRTNRSDPSVIKAARRRRKAGYLSSATYKKWEKAATAGVSLVADAAEHLERTISDRETEPNQGLLGQKGSVAVGSILPPPPPPLQEANVERKMQKLKLQLFPIDGATQRALETNNHNPHLELTLSCRKKISSVLEHLNRKWGNSRTASGELTLFPYSVRRENLIGYQRWTQESVLTAADLHLMIGSPALFRLRYGWVSNCELGHVDAEPAPAFCCGNKPSSVAKCTTCGPSSSGFSDEVIGFSGVHRDNHGPGSFASDANILWQGRESEDRTTVKQLKELDNPKLSTSTPSAGEWADSLTNISMGDLLSETPHEMNADCVDAHVVRSSHALELPFTSDSFDAAIASHISRNLASTNFQSPNSTSILDAEETCDAFSFRDNPVLLHRRGPMERAGSHGLIEKLPEEESGIDHPSNDDAVDGGDGDRDVLARSPQADDGEPDALITFYHNEKDIGGLADIYWPDSLGPLDLDMPSSRYDDLILSDNQSGLNRLISGSLDAFQNCSYSGL